MNPTAHSPARGTASSHAARWSIHAAITLAITIHNPIHSGSPVSATMGASRNMNPGGLRMPTPLIMP